MLSIVLSAVDLNSDDKNKFESIYNIHKNVLYYHALKIVRNESDAEDVLQEAFFKIAKNINAIDDVKSKETICSYSILLTKSFNALSSTNFSVSLSGKSMIFDDFLM